MNAVTVFFWGLSAVAILGALLCITRKNPVASALWLVLTLFALSGIYVLLDAHFIAVMQVIVYAGAIMVLFLFVIMLLRAGAPGSASDIKGTAGRVTALVLDVRNNGGGNNFLNRPIVREVIRSDGINRKGRFFVITGRLTFSAAANSGLKLPERIRLKTADADPTGPTPVEFEITAGDKKGQFPVTITPAPAGRPVTMIVTIK